MPGNADLATWQVEVSVRRLDSGHFDFGGPFIHGKRGERFLGLRWVDVTDGDRFDLFRAAGLRLNAVEPALTEQASQPGKRLLGRLGLTDERGFPRCHGVRPPDIEWTVPT